MYFNTIHLGKYLNSVRVSTKENIAAPSLKQNHPSTFHSLIV